MSLAEIVRTCNLLEAAHRSDAPFQMLVVPFDPIVQVLRRAMLHIGQERTERLRITLGFVGRDPGRRYATSVDRLLKERVRRCGIPALTEIDVNDLPVFIDRPIQVAPASTDLEVNGTIINDKFCMTRWIERPRLGRGHAVLPHHTSR